jgi:hypothetical protein
MEPEAKRWKQRTDRKRRKARYGNKVPALEDSRGFSGNWKDHTETTGETKEDEVPRERRCVEGR